MKKEVLKRMPPGDRWSEITGQDITEHSGSKLAGETLTDALNFIYAKYKVKVFEVDAAKGIVSIDDGKKEPIKSKEYSLYDE